MGWLGLLAPPLPNRVTFRRWLTPLSLGFLISDTTSQDVKIGCDNSGKAAGCCQPGRLWYLHRNITLVFLSVCDMSLRKIGLDVMVLQVDLGVGRREPYSGKLMG